MPLATTAPGAYLRTHAIGDLVLRGKLATFIRENNQLRSESRKHPTFIQSLPDQEALEAGLAPLREDDIARMDVQFQNLLTHSTPSIKAHGEALFRRIATANWSVEWNLPRWLNRVCALSDTQLKHLVAANVYGLGYVRLLDDRHDGEIPSQENEAIRSLEAILFQAALSEFQQLLGDNAHFWEFFEVTLARWHQAEGLLPHNLNVLEMTRVQIASLADVGAPLSIACAAGRLLDPASPALAVLTDPVRHYLIAAVLYDHLKDWPEDLASARPNHFVLAMLDTPAEALAPAAVRLKLYAAIIDRVKVSEYCRLITNQLALGAKSAGDVGMDAFARHLRALELEVHESGELMVREIDRLLNEGAEILIPKRLSD